MATFMYRNGRVTARVRMGGVCKTKTFERKRDAAEWAEEVERRLKGGIVKRDVSKLTVADLIDAYFDYLNENDSQLGQDKWYSLRFTRKEIGHWKGDTLTRARLMEYAKERAAAGASGATLQAQFCYLSTVLKTLRLELDYDVDLAAYNEFMAVSGQNGTLKLRGKSVPRDRVMSPEEERRLMEWFRTKNNWQLPMVDLVQFSLMTALRRSETTGILWDDIDHESRSVLIRSRKHPNPAIKERNNVWVRLFGSAYSIVMAQPRTDERVFPYRGQTVSGVFKIACDALGIENLRWHDLRATSLTRMEATGVLKPSELMKQSGHTRMDMLSRYLRPEVKDLPDPFAGLT